MMKYINNVNMKRKLLFSYLILITLPICIIGYFLTSALYRTSFSNVSNISGATFKQIEGNFSNKLTQYTDIVNTIANDSVIRNYIETSYDQAYEAYEDFNAKIKPLINSASYSDRSVEIRIYSSNNTIDVSYVTNNSMAALDTAKWFRKPADFNGGIQWTFKDKSQSYDNNVYIGCYKVLMDNYKENRIEAVISVFFNENQLYKLVSEEKKAGKIIFLYNESGDIITTTERDLLLKPVGGTGLEGLIHAGQFKNGTVNDYEGKNYLVFTSELNDSEINLSGWHLVYMVPANKVLSDIDKIWFTSLALCLICIVFTTFVIFMLSRNITGRISRLIDKINKIWSGDFTVAKEVSGKDEIGELEIDFYRMVDKIDVLINEVYKAEINNQIMQRQKKEAELIALHGQINPHYLFNTLETIRMKLVNKKDRETANIIKVFADSFRTCLENQDSIYTLREELEFIRKYFLIQQYRYEDKIRLDIRIPDRLYTYALPKLVIQPLVENAIYHGIEKKMGKGMIAIESAETEDELIIRVTDDGVGIEEEKLEHIKRIIYGEAAIEQTRRTTGFALRNIHNRLSLLYGGNFGLKLSSEKDKGTCVEIKLPNHGTAGS